MTGNGLAVALAKNEGPFWLKEISVRPSRLSTRIKRVSITGYHHPHIRQAVVEANKVMGEFVKIPIK